MPLKKALFRACPGIERPGVASDRALARPPLYRGIAQQKPKTPKSHILIGRNITLAVAVAVQTLEQERFRTV